MGITFCVTPSVQICKIIPETSRSLHTFRPELERRVPITLQFKEIMY